MPPVKGVGDLPYLACHMILGGAFQVNLARKWLWGHSLSWALVQLLCSQLFFFLEGTRLHFAMAQTDPGLHR